MNSGSNLRCTISGSFRRFLSEIADARSNLMRLGVEVLSPANSEPIDPSAEFVVLSSDTGSPKEIETAHLRAIASSDFLVLVNPGGYLGPSATMEIGYALGRGIPVFAMFPPRECVIGLFVRVRTSLEDIVREIKESKSSFQPGASLAVIQSYIKRVVVERGFSDESIRDVVLLLVEEVGELAKAIRRQSGLKVENGADPNVVREELADCLIYLVDIANLADVCLEDALREKELKNSKREWSVNRAREST